MPKQIKGNASRKPPVAANSHAEIAAWMDTVMPAVKPIVEATHLPALTAAMLAPLPR